ncbi:MAG: hypothetical protein WBY93_11295 [Candidatus Binatus sp.]
MTALFALLILFADGRTAAYAQTAGDSGFPDKSKPKIKALTASPKKLGFGDLPPLEASSPKTVTIHNPNSTAIEINSITSSNSEFVPSVGCVGSLAADGDCGGLHGVIGRQEISQASDLERCEPKSADRQHDWQGQGHAGSEPDRNRNAKRYCNADHFGHSNGDGHGRHAHCDRDSQHDGYCNCDQDRIEYVDRDAHGHGYARYSNRDLDCNGHGNHNADRDGDGQGRYCDRDEDSNEYRNRDGHERYCQCDRDSNSNGDLDAYCDRDCNADGNCDGHNDGDCYRDSNGHEHCDRDEDCDAHRDRDARQPHLAAGISTRRDFWGDWRDGDDLRRGHYWIRRRRDFARFIEHRLRRFLFAHAHLPRR